MQTYEEGLRKVEGLAKKLKGEGNPIPVSVAEIEGFPCRTYSHTVAKIGFGQLRLTKFSTAYETSLINGLSSPGESAWSSFLAVANFLAPIAGLVLAFVIAWWFAVLGVVGAVLSLRETRRQYLRILFRSALESEIVFCFLYYSKQISIIDNQTKAHFFWREKATSVSASKSPMVEPSSTSAADGRGEVGHPQPTLARPTDEQMKAVRTRYLEVLKDIGGTANPEDYAGDLTYMPPTDLLPPPNTTHVCGCCCIPFAAQMRKIGGWIARNKKTGMPNPICGVCVGALGARVVDENGQLHYYTLHPEYDMQGQEFIERWGDQPMLTIAIMRMALFDSRLRARAALDGGPSKG